MRVKRNLSYSKSLAVEPPGLSQAAGQRYSNLHCHPQITSEREKRTQQANRTDTLLNLQPDAFHMTERETHTHTDGDGELDREQKREKRRESSLNPCYVHMS